MIKKRCIIFPYSKHDRCPLSFRKFKINFANQISEENNPILQSQDTIYVYKNKAAQAGDFLSNFSQPIRDFLGIYTLTEIIKDN